MSNRNLNRLSLKPGVKKRISALFNKKDQHLGQLLEKREKDNLKNKINKLGNQMSKQEFSEVIEFGRKFLEKLKKGEEEIDKKIQVEVD